MSKSIIKVWILGLTAFSIILLSGCVERELTINTEPAGGRVFLNDEEVGIAPVTVSFLWYGNYNVKIVKDGYQTLNTTKNLKAPLHDKFPLDFFAEVIWPGHIKDSYVWDFQLDKFQRPSREQLLDDAESTRQEAIYELN